MMISVFKRRQIQSTQVQVHFRRPPLYPFRKSHQASVRLNAEHRNLLTSMCTHQYTYKRVILTQEADTERQWDSSDSKMDMEAIRQIPVTGALSHPSNLGESLNV